MLVSVSRWTASKLTTGSVPRTTCAPSRKGTISSLSIVSTGWSCWLTSKRISFSGPSVSKSK